MRVLRREHAALEMEIRINGGLENRLRLRELEAEIVRLGSSVRFVFSHLRGTVIDESAERRE